MILLSHIYWLLIGTYHNTITITFLETFLEKFLTPICFAYLKTHSMGWDSRYRDPGGHISCLVTKKGDINLPPFYSLVSAVIASSGHLPSLMRK